MRRLFSIAAVFVAACSSDSGTGTGACTEGTVIECSIPNECTTGTRTCNATGAWGACVCGSEGTGGALTGGTGGNAGCPQGETRLCVGPGACAGGQVCEADGTWGICDCGTATGGTGGVGGSSGTGGALGGTGGAFGGTGGTGGTGGQYTGCTTFSGIGGCSSYTSEEAQIPEVNVLLVVDKSGSMADQPAGWSETKWDGLSRALSSALNPVKGVMSFGLEFFPSEATAVPIPFTCGEPTNRCCEMPDSADMNVDVGPGVATVPSIVSTINGANPTGGTPTSVALQRAYEYFASGPGSTLAGDRVVLLVTDGGPNCNSGITCGVDTCTLNLDEKPGCPSSGANCCTGTAGVGCLDDSATMVEITRLTSNGIQTIVVGIPGAEVYTPDLQAFAVAGGFPGGLYMVSAAGGVAELTQTFQTITAQLVPGCEVAVPPAVPNLNAINLAVDCNVLPKGDGAAGAGQDSWTFDNPNTPTRMIISGPICDTIQTIGVQRIDTVFDCPTITLQ